MHKIMQSTEIDEKYTINTYVDAKTSEIRIDYEGRLNGVFYLDDLISALSALEVLEDILETGMDLEVKINRNISVNGSLDKDGFKFNLHDNKLGYICPINGEVLTDIIYAASGSIFKSTVTLKNLLEDLKRRGIIIQDQTISN